jgi:hypothetical protein
MRGRTPSIRPSRSRSAALPWSSAGASPDLSTALRGCRRSTRLLGWPFLGPACRPLLPASAPPTPRERPSTAGRACAREFRGEPPDPRWSTSFAARSPRRRAVPSPPSSPSGAGAGLPSSGRRGGRRSRRSTHLPLALPRGIPEMKMAQDTLDHCSRVMAAMIFIIWPQERQRDGSSIQAFAMSLPRSACVCGGRGSPLLLFLRERPLEAGRIPQGEGRSMGGRARSRWAEGGSAPGAAASWWTGRSRSSARSSRTPAEARKDPRSPRCGKRAAEESGSRSRHLGDAWT